MSFRIELMEFDYTQHVDTMRNTCNCNLIARSRTKSFVNDVTVFGYVFGRNTIATFTLLLFCVIFRMSYLESQTFVWYLQLHTWWPLKIRFHQIPLARRIRYDGVKGGNSGTLSYFSNFAYNSGFMQHRYGALASSIILLWSNALYVCLLATYIFLLWIL